MRPLLWTPKTVMSSLATANEYLIQRLPKNTSDAHLQGIKRKITYIRAPRARIAANTLLQRVVHEGIATSSPCLQLETTG